MKHWLPLLLAVLCAACAVQPQPVDLHYRLEGFASAAVLPADAPSVLVEPFDAFGLYAERPLMFRRAEAGGAVEQYRHQFWIEPPALMLGDGLRRTLRAALGEAKVHPRNARDRAAYVIKPRLRRLEQMFDASGARAEFAVDFLVTDEANAPRFVLAFEQIQPIASDSPAAFAKAASELAAQANTKLVERLALEFAR